MVTARGDVAPAGTVHAGCMPSKITDNSQLRCWTELDASAERGTGSPTPKIGRQVRTGDTAGQRPQARSGCRHTNPLGSEIIRCA